MRYSRTGLANLVVTGDFNYPNIEWNLGCSIDSHPEAEDFCNILDDFFFIQKNMYAARDSRNPNLDKFLDIVLSAFDQRSPQIALKRRSRPPWINNEIIKLVRKKTRLWRLWFSGSVHEV